MRKKVYLIIAVISFIAFFTGIPYLVNGIQARGLGGVNYGRIIFPLLIGLLVLYAYKRQK